METTCIASSGWSSSISSQHMHVALIDRNLCLSLSESLSYTTCLKGKLRLHKRVS